MTHLLLALILFPTLQTLECTYTIMLCNYVGTLAARMFWIVHCKRDNILNNESQLYRTPFRTQFCSDLIRHRD